MPFPPKVERNKEIINLRNKDPKYYSWAVLARIFGVSRQAVREVYYKYSK